MVQVIIEDVVACFFETQCICTEWLRKKVNHHAVCEHNLRKLFSTTVSFL